MRVCSMCGEAYAEEVEYCEIHGVALSSWEDEATRIADTEEELEPPSWEAGEGEGEPRSGVTDDDTTARIGDVPPRPAPPLPPPPHAVTIDPGDECTRVATPRRAAPVLAASPPEGPDPLPPVVPAPRRAPAAATEEPRQDRVLSGRYRLGRRISIGGFGVVFTAQDLRLDKPVTVKVLSPHIARDRDSLTQFRRDAVAASRVSHPSIANITDFDRDASGSTFVVMEHLDGCDLKQLLHDVGALPPPRALPIAIQIAKGLQATHRRGIIHRDLKPAAIFLVRPGALGDEVKLIDFGISRVMGQRRIAVDRRPGDVMGSPCYMAPERLEGADRGDVRVDVYSLGVLLYEMLVGAPPFTGADHRAIAAQHLTSTAEPPSARRAGLPRTLDAVVLRALAKQPDDRYASMVQLSAALVDELRRVDPAAAARYSPDEAGAPPSGASRPKYTTTEAVWPRRRQTRSLAMRTHRRPRAEGEAAPRSRRWLVVAVAGALVVIAIVGTAVAIL